MDHTELEVEKEEGEEESGVGDVDGGGQHHASPANYGRHQIRLGVSP